MRVVRAEGLPNGVTSFVRLQLEPPPGAARSDASLEECDTELVWDESSPRWDELCVFASGAAVPLSRDKPARHLLRREAAQAAGAAAKARLAPRPASR